MIQSSIRIFSVILLFCAVCFGQDKVDMLNEIKVSMKNNLATKQDSLAGDLMKMPSIQARMKATSMLKTREETRTPELVLDRAIDPALYVLGPGDKFEVSMWGKFEDVLELEVNSEGNLVVPRIGVFDVRGKTLAETKATLEQELLGVFRGVKISVTLSEIRQFKCYVLGEVLRPGAYLVTGVARVSDIIVKAGGISDSGATRGIDIVNDRLTPQIADMAAFFNAGDAKANPYLREGDRVFVPKRSSYVGVHGFVNYPGDYDFRPGDKVTDLIRAAGGFSLGVDSSAIKILRFTDDRDALEEIAVHAANAATAEVNCDDRIVVKGSSQFRRHRQVRIEGEVLSPGTYPVQGETTRLSDVIAMAGGLTTRASLGNSRIIRDTIMLKNDPEFERLKSVAPERLDPTEMAYVKTRARQQAIGVSIDFAKMGGDEAEVKNVVVYDGDKIVIGRNDKSVCVSGAVASPGHVVYKPGSDYKYYVYQAGGWGPRASKKWIRVRRQGSGAWLSIRDAGTIQSGDEILVAEKVYRDSFNTVRDVLVILSSVATVLLTAVTIQDILKNQ